MNISAELEQAAVYLLRARELAQFFGYPQRDIDRLDMLKRAVAKQRSEMNKEKSA